MSKKALSPEVKAAFLVTLKTRFEANTLRHKGVSWEAVESRLRKKPVALWSLYEMEKSGGEPDVVMYDNKSDQYWFFDCSSESPSGRRSICYDEAALEARKENKPGGSAQGLASKWGISLLTEADTRLLQKTGTYDQKTSSWIETPADIRERGGALFSDSRYGKVFVYHNGAESYYAARGFRGKVAI